MANARVTPPGNKPAAPVATDVTDETFNYTLPDGSLVVCGKPRGVLKLRLRNITTEIQRKDPELAAIATAFMCIRTINGKPPVLTTEREFEALVNRFGSDEAVDEFMQLYQNLINPEAAAILKKALELAVENKWETEQIQDYITTEVMKLEVERRNKVRD